MNAWISRSFHLIITGYPNPSPTHLYIISENGE